MMEFVEVSRRNLTTEERLDKFKFDIDVFYDGVIFFVKTQCLCDFEWSKLFT